MLKNPAPHGGRSTVSGIEVEVTGRRSAKPEGAGKVVSSMMRQASRVTSPPVLFVNVRRMSKVPNVVGPPLPEKSRTRLGGALELTQLSSSCTSIDALRWIGDERFCGPGAPRRCPAPADVPFV